MASLTWKPSGKSFLRPQEKSRGRQAALRVWEVPVPSHRSSSDVLIPQAARGDLSGTSCPQVRLWAPQVVPRSVQPTARHRLMRLFHSPLASCQPGSLPVPKICRPSKGTHMTASLRAQSKQAAALSWPPHVWVLPPRSFSSMVPRPLPLPPLARFLFKRFRFLTSTSVLDPNFLAKSPVATSPPFSSYSGHPLLLSHYLR